MLTSPSLPQLGWRTHFSIQLTLDELTLAFPARVAAVHRDTLVTFSEYGEITAHLPRRLSIELSSSITVGDWLLIERATHRVSRVLDRFSVLERQAAGTDHRQQLIAANVDTLFVATSLNDDFNLSRLERYLALALHAQVEPVVILTKADLCDDVDDKLAQVTSITRAACVAVNATSPDSVLTLRPWLDPGQTVALVGSSGVGKSTLINQLLGSDVQPTRSIREDDSKGRHTTTARELLHTPQGAWVIDTPGMRELKIGAADTGVRLTFNDVEALAHQCRFRDCQHEHEHGCAVLEALATGALDARRLESYRKLKREAERAARTLAEQRDLERRWGRMHRGAQKQRRRQRGRDG